VTPGFRWLQSPLASWLGMCCSFTCKTPFTLRKHWVCRTYPTACPLHNTFPDIPPGSSAPSFELMRVSLIIWKLLAMCSCVVALCAFGSLWIGPVGQSRFHACGPSSNPSCLGPERPLTSLRISLKGHCCHTPHSFHLKVFFTYFVLHLKLILSIKYLKHQSQ
jgi:hypothetical protein